MDFNKFFDDIGLDSEGRAVFEKYEAKMSNSEFSSSMEICFDEFRRYDEFKRGTEFSESLEKIAAKESVPTEELNLYVCLRSADKTVEEYTEKGIDLSLFYGTVSRELVNPCKAYYEKNGIYGIPPVLRRWTRRAIYCKLFKIGILNFEIAESRYDTEIGGIKIKVGDPCLSVHIPRGNLDEAECEKSYALAKEFYSKYFGLNPVVFFCYSWLLQPWLLDVLGEDSKIAKFQKKYKNVDFVNDPGDVLRWVFPNPAESPEKYPEDTVIQRATKKRILNGEIIGYGSGVRL